MSSDVTNIDDAENDVIHATVNGDPKTPKYEPGDTLMRTLRRAGHSEIKNGCSEGICGSCNILYGENQVVRSCLIPTEQYDGEDLVTAKGLVRDDGSLHPVQDEFLDHGPPSVGSASPG